MAHRPLSLVTGLSLGCLLIAPSLCLAETADWDARLAQAAQLRADSEQKLQAADALLTQEKAACQTKFQVNACINDAEQRHLVVRRENRARIIEADRIERAVKSEQRSARMAEKAERQATRTAEYPPARHKVMPRHSSLKPCGARNCRARNAMPPSGSRKKPNSRPPINANWPNMKPA